MKAVVASFNQEKALVGAFSVITNLRKELIEALIQRLLLLLQTMENAITEQSGSAETEQGNIRHIRQLRTELSENMFYILFS